MKRAVLGNQKDAPPLKMLMRVSHRPFHPPAQCNIYVSLLHGNKGEPEIAWFDSCVLTCYLFRGLQCPTIGVSAVLPKLDEASGGTGHKPDLQPVCTRIFQSLVRAEDGDATSLRNRIVWLKSIRRSS